MSIGPDKTHLQIGGSGEEMLPQGTVIGGRYRLERTLGAGGMGVVYLAVHLELKKAVALKTLLPHLASRPEFVARFRREAEALARVRHRHIVGVTDFGDDQGRYYLVFDYVEGGTLEAYDETHSATGGLSNAEIARLLCEILEGLAHIHASGTVHRDLKPANILLEKTGEARISDFGLARFTDSDGARAGIARPPAGISLAEAGATSGYVGTADFMAPEVKLLKPATERSDIYAMGVLTYWLLTGRRPGAMSGPVSRTAKARKLGTSWDKLVARALAEEPGERFASATEMSAAVKAALASATQTGRGARSIALAAAALMIAAGMYYFFEHAPALLPPVKAVPHAGLAETVVKPLPAVTLIGLPTGAKISVEGGPFVEVAGLTHEVDLPEDRTLIDVAVHAPGFETWRGRLGGTNQREQQSLRLEPLRPKPVTVTGLPTGTKISVAGGPFTDVAESTHQVDLPEDGTLIDVAVRALGFETWRGRLGGTNQREQQPLRLEPMRPKPISLAGLPAGARVKIGEEEKSAGADGRATFSLFPGVVKISASAKRFESLEKTFVLTEEQTELRAEMVRIQQAKEIEIPLTNEVKLRVRLVESGEFTAGASTAEAGPTSGPNPVLKTKVAEAFYLGVYEVTQEEYVTLLKTNPSASRALREGRRPVERISWAQLRSPDGFIARLNTRLGELNLPYRADLPTETEWEYACRAGAEDIAENGGGGGAAATALKTIAVFNSNEGVPSRVGERKPNAWGFYDMLGNIAEWTRDEPVLRGGNWRAPAAACRFSSRLKVAATAVANDTMGFRIVLRPTEEL